MDTSFLSVLTGRPCGNTPFYWTHQDQLEARTHGYQIPTISSRCLLDKYSPFSCSFLTLCVMALEILDQDMDEGLIPLVASGLASRLRLKSSVIFVLSVLMTASPADWLLA